jgi:5-methyltetrahydropteroyltriglutamate--homocysteine methyltransferase
MSMEGKPLDTCMMNMAYREKFQDAMAVVLSFPGRAITC